MSNSKTLADIVNVLGGQVDGDATVVCQRVASLKFATPEAIGFFNDTKYTQTLKSTKAAAVVIKPEFRHLTDLPCILTDNPYAYFARLSELFNPPMQYRAEIHPTAVIEAKQDIPASVSIAANVYIGHGVNLGERVRVGAGCVIEHGVSIADDTVLEANVVVKHGSFIGKRCHFFAGAVIGNDGFGYAEEQGRWVKIPQIGRVVIGDDVDIGSNTTVDRGALDDTVIEDGVKIDNLVQIAHNCRIGAHTVIAGCVGIAGSAVLGAHCRIGGAAMILGHLTIADKVTISPGSMIMRSIPKAGTYTALMPFQAHEDWLKTAANIRHLSELAEKVNTIEATLKVKDNIKKD